MEPPEVQKLDTPVAVDRERAAPPGQQCPRKTAASVSNTQFSSAWSDLRRSSQEAPGQTVRRVPHPRARAIRVSARAIGVRPGGDEAVRHAHDAPEAAGRQDSRSIAGEGLGAFGAIAVQCSPSGLYQPKPPSWKSPGSKPWSAHTTFRPGRFVSLICRTPSLKVTSLHATGPIVIRPETKLLGDPGVPVEVGVDLGDDAPGSDADRLDPALEGRRRSRARRVGGRSARRPGR